MEETLTLQSKDISINGSFELIKNIVFEDSYLGVDVNLEASTIKKNDISFTSKLTDLSVLYNRLTELSGELSCIITLTYVDRGKIGEGGGFAVFSNGELLLEEKLSDSPSIEERRKWNKRTFDILHEYEDKTQFNLDDNWDLVDDKEEYKDFLISKLKSSFPDVYDWAREYAYEQYIDLQNERLVPQEDDKNPSINSVQPLPTVVAELQYQSNGERATALFISEVEESGVEPLLLMKQEVKEELYEIIAKYQKNPSSHTLDFINEGYSGELLYMTFRNYEGFCADRILEMQEEINEKCKKFNLYFKVSTKEQQILNKTTKTIDTIAKLMLL